MRKKDQISSPSNEDSAIIEEEEGSDAEHSKLDDNSDDDKKRMAKKLKKHTKGQINKAKQLEEDNDDNEAELCALEEEGLDIDEDIIDFDAVDADDNDEDDKELDANAEASDEVEIASIIKEVQ